MAKFIAPVVDWVMASLTAMAPPAGLPGWGEVRQSWTFVSAAWPPIAVMPRTTDFDDESADVHQMHSLTIKFGVQASDPDTVTVNAMAYMLAVDAAIQAAVWLPSIRRVFVVRHDYGPLFQKDSSWTKFPELHLDVETRELYS